MAAATRNERQLMRQRGAGLRGAGNIDFALDLNSHGSRDERQLMRRRGAGSRQIDSVDFGFAFSTPRHGRRSTSQTPLSSRRSLTRASKTPTTRASRERSAPKSSRRTSASVEPHPSVQRQLSQEPTIQQDNDSEQSSAKRRKLEAAETHLRRSSARRRTSALDFAIAEEIENAGSSPVAAGRQIVAASPLFFPDDADKENQSFEIDKIAQTSPKIPAHNLTRRRTRSSNNVLEDSIAESVEEDEEPLLPIDDASSTTQSKDNAELSAEVDLPEASVQARSAPVAKPAKRRRKRKSVVLGRKKRRSSGTDSARADPIVHEEATEAGTAPDEFTTQTLEEEPSLDLINTTEEVEEIDDGSTLQRPFRTTANRDPARRRGRLSMTASPRPPQSDDDEEDGTYVDEEHTPDPTTPAAKRKGVKTQRLTAQEKPTINKKRKRDSSSTFPILTHRMANVHALPTIAEEGNQDQYSDDERPMTSNLFKDRAVPNAVDVLAQICRETIETTIEQLRTSHGSTTSATKGELAAKRAALEKFGKELDQRLFDMSEAVEYRMTLEARLRKSKREKADLQARWIDIRRQRDELGLRADGIRRQNWENEETSKRQWEASQLAQQFELDLEQEVPEDSLEYSLRTVAASVSDTGNDSGILQRVQSFNAQLERVAHLLERR